MLGALLAIGSAFAFSTSDVAVRRGVARATIAQGAFITVLLGVPLFAAASLASGQLFNLGDLSLESYIYLSTAGIIHYVGGRYFNYAAISAIGATRSSPIQALSLPYAVLIAYIFLDETITLGMGFGIVLILIGPLLMLERRTSASAPVIVSGTTASYVEIETAVPVAEAAPSVATEPQTIESEPAFVLRQAEGYVFATLSAIAYGTSPVLIRAALEGESGVSILGGLVSYVAAAAVLVLSLLLPHRRGLVRSLNVEMLRVFFAAGFSVFMAQMLRFIALSMTSVAVVTTLLRLGSLFTLVLSWMLNRHLEHITLRTVIGIIVSLAGAVLLIATQP